MNESKISFNVNLAAKEVNPNSVYRVGPYQIQDEEELWILTEIKNLCPYKDIVAEGVRLAMEINRISDTETVVESIVTCPDAEPDESRCSIRFICDKPFELQYYEGSDYLYSEYRGLDGQYGIPLMRSVMIYNGALIGFEDVDGKIPGGMNNRVSVSIKVKVL